MKAHHQIIGYRVLEEGYPVLFRKALALVEALDEMTGKCALTA